MNVHLSIIIMRYNLSKQTKTINHVEHRERERFFSSLIIPMKYSLMELPMCSKLGHPRLTRDFSLP